MGVGLKLIRQNDEGGDAHDAWTSWDRHPWRHPWLNYHNLRAMRDFSATVWEQAKQLKERLPRWRWHRPPDRRLHYGFVGNIANSLYTRAVPLRRAGLDVSIFLHPQDNYVMSQPGWEEFDGELPDGVTDISELVTRHISLPHVQDVYRFAEIHDCHLRNQRQFPRFVTAEDFSRWKPYLSFLATLEALQKMDALLATQAPYLAYLAHRPYLVAQSGGDIWFECSRDDLLGRLQRRAFFSARAFIVSNPWSFAHARRFGMQHLVYMPLILDEEIYSPGASVYREEWAKKSGGSFFVLATARMDNFYKGSDIAIEGFAAFSRLVPGARLVVMGWGENQEASLTRLQAYGVADKVIVLPIAGKKRLIQYLRAADCLLDQFVLGYFGATGLEAMACGLPVIMRLERHQYDGMCLTGAPPVLNASTAEEICAALQTLASDLLQRKDIASEHRAWFLANHGSERWKGVYSDMLAATALGHKFDFSKSPLAAPLSGEEKAYHAEELANAPKFPNYR
ncbi:MAG: glycosyltransferase [Burkholderiales bacterium]